MNNETSPDALKKYFSKTQKYETQKAEFNFTATNSYRTGERLDMHATGLYSHVFAW